MFRCQICHCVVAARTAAIRVILETRPKRYPLRPKQYLPPPDPKKRKGKKQKRLKTMPPLDKRKDWLDDPGGNGLEIVREVLACASCAQAQATAD
jgi:hypothetical protein